MRTNQEIQLLEIRQTLKEELQRLKSRKIIPFLIIKKLQKDLKTAETLLVTLRKHKEII